VNNLIIKSKRTAYRFFLLVVLFMLNSLLSAQPGVDSLKNELFNSGINDTNYINKCLDVAWGYMYTNADSAEVYAQKALDVSKKVNVKLLIANSYNTIGVTHIVRGNYQLAISNLNNALSIGNILLGEDSKSRKIKRRMLSFYTNAGNVYYYLSNYAEAIKNYQQALRFSEDINFLPGIANCLSNIGASYKDLLEFDKALEYNYKALAFAREIDDSYWLSQSLNNLGSIYFSIPDYDSARYYFAISMKQLELDSNEFELINSYVNMGSVYQKLSIYDSALFFYNKGLRLSKKLASTDGLINVYYMMGQMYNKLHNYPEAISHLKQSIKLANEAGTNRFIMLGNEELSKTYFELKDFKKAFIHYKLGSVMRDSIFSTEHDERIAELEAKYQTREKEERIKLLLEQNMLEVAQSQNRQIIFVSIIIILVLLLVAIALAYRSYKHKQIAEKSLMKQRSERRVLDAVIKTEYEERKRFAEELHDAMGALLSTLKLYVNELGSKDIVYEERNVLLQQSNHLLDEAITNARTISHNIMPASIKENGLESSLQSFIDKINAYGKIQIQFITLSLRKHFEPVLELSVYRMLTEMINNSLKHAEADKIEISLSEKNNKLLISFMDNGKGFDFEKTIKSGNAGLGLKNILSRIEMIGGKHHFLSKKGEGFTATIEVAL